MFTPIFSRSYLVAAICFDAMPLMVRMCIKLRLIFAKHFTGETKLTSVNAFPEVLKALAFNT